MGTTAAPKTVTLEDVLLYVKALEERVAALERSTGQQPAPEPSAFAPPPPQPSLALSRGTFATLAKALLAFAGAYLLRAFAESGVIPQSLGVLTGLLYAGFWLVWATRVPAFDQTALTLYTLTSTLIFSGLVWENSVNLHVLPSVASAAVIAGFSCAGQFLAWRRDRPRIAAITTGVSAALAVALLFSSHDLTPYTAALLVIAAITELPASRGRWTRHRWFPALAADLAILIVAWVITRPQGLPETYPLFGMSSVVALQIALVLIYVLAMAWRTLIAGGDISTFEIAQNTIAIGLFIWGSVVMGREAPAARLVVESFCLLAGLACYTAAVRFLAHQTRPRNFLVYGLFGLALVMAGISILFSGSVLVFVWCALAVAVSWLGTHEHRLSLQLHAPVFLLAAAIGSGLIEFARQTLHGTTVPAEARLIEIAVVTLALALCYAMAAPGEPGKARLPAALIAALLSWSLLGLGAATLSTLLGPASTLTSTLRTGLICALALILSRSSARRSELTWLLYPLMLYGAYRLLTEDFPQGNPTALALSLLFYGGTLLQLTRRTLAS
ncbi:MAG TPA: hypothetical protein VGL72_18260 [Bryobacteraceae bacterium]|jgi:hypothetical protein